MRLYHLVRYGALFCAKMSLHVELWEINEKDIGIIQGPHMMTTFLFLKGVADATDAPEWVFSYLKQRSHNKNEGCFTRACEIWHASKTSASL